MDIMQYVKPELLIVAIVCYVVGIGLKKTQTIKDKYIPFILGSGSIVLCAIWVFANSQVGSAQEIASAVFMAVTQGILMAGLSTYVNQLIKQAKQKEDISAE